mgnify:CR=1 FL=1
MEWGARSPGGRIQVGRSAAPRRKLFVARLFNIPTGRVHPPESVRVERGIEFYIFIVSRYSSISICMVSPYNCAHHMRDSNRSIMSLVTVTLPPARRTLRAQRGDYEKLREDSQGYARIDDTRFAMLTSLSNSSGKFNYLYGATVQTTSAGKISA